MKSNKVSILAFFLSLMVWLPELLRAQGIEIPVGTTMVITGAATIEINDGGLINNGTYTKGSETITFSGNETNTISGSQNIDMHNLVLTDTAQITTQLGNLTVNNLTINNLTTFNIDPGMAVTATGTVTNSAGAFGLVVESAETSNASLILTNEVVATVQRYLTNGTWHIMSFPVSGQVIGSFVTQVSNYIGWNSAISRWGMMPYDPANNVWGSYFDGNEATPFDIGEGYMLRRKSSQPSGVVTATGTLQAGDKTISGLIPERWNCIGNPYSSALGITTSYDAVNNFLTVNEANLDLSYGAIYLWDEQPGYSGPLVSNYEVISNAGYTLKNNLQMGQGFLVKMKAGAETLNFTSLMQSHQVGEAYLKKSAAPWPGFELLVSASNLTASTIVTFNESMTVGLDPTYDAGILKGNVPLAVYTRLASDNGIGFAIQCLPLDGSDTIVLPVGVDFPAGGEIAFTVKADRLPFGSRVILEDRLLGTFTNLVENPPGYTINLPGSTSGTGRFYIHTGTAQATAIPAISEKLQVYASGKNIFINGEVSPNALISLYSLQGALVRSYSPESSANLQLDAEGVMDGIYLLSITSNQNKKQYKLFLGNGW